MVLQEKLLDFDNQTIVLQPSNLVALFFPRPKDAAEAVEGDDAAADKSPPNTATKQAFESGDTEADKDAAKQTFGSEDAATKQTFGSADAANIATKQTFQSMGLRCEKYVTEHLLLKNAYQSNLLSDISKVDYLEENLGNTNLHLLEGLTAFVDDIFVFGYVSQEECVFQRGKLCCTSQEKRAEKLVVASIANALKEPWGKGATCRHPLCTQSRSEKLQPAQSMQQLRKLGRTHSAGQKENGKKSTRKKRLPGISWQNAMFRKSLWRISTAVCMFSKNVWRAMATESTASTTRRIFQEFWIAKRLWPTLVFERQGISAQQSPKNSRRF